MAKTYNFKEVTVTINGVPITGFADGDAITVAQDADLWSKVTGNDDTTARARLNNSSALITLVLLSTSDANDILFALAKADAESGLGQFSIQVRDIRGRKLHFCGDAWIRRIPDVPYGRDVSNLEWMIDCGTLDNTIGGNT